MSSPSQAHIIEVGTRDGIQAEKQFVETDQKLRMLELILAAGVRRVEVTSFVSPRHVPQMADAEAVLTGMNRPPGVEVEALVPNMRGMERALECRLDRVVLFVAASEGFNLKNLRAGREKMIAAAREAAKEALRAGLKIRGGIVTAFGCPYEGRVPIEAVEKAGGRICRHGLRRGGPR